MEGKRKMKKKQIGGMVVAALLFIAIGVTNVLSNRLSESLISDTVQQLLASGTELSLPSENYIGVVSVDGTIQAQTANTSIFGEITGYQHTDTLEFIDKMMYDSSNKGILLRVNSPGGTVYESEELYLKLQEYKEVTERPIWTYMEHYAASGGYYVAAPSDRIIANPNTTTGSIGVIMSGYDMTGLYEKLGIKYISITSGENKDSSVLGEEQIEIYQVIVDEMYERFVEIVADGRRMSKEEVKKLADGRIYTAKQALGNGLIDDIALFGQAVQEMQSELGVYTFYAPGRVSSPFAGIFGKLEELKPKTEAEILTKLAKEFDKGVPMYYAEQLQ